MYELIYASTQGASHVKNGIPCEDYGKVCQSEECSLFAVADGHGDTNCPRSSFGSRVACETALSELEKFCFDIRESEWTGKLVAGGKETEKIMRQLISSIIAKWDMAVNDDFEKNPLNDEERAGCNRYLERYDRGERIEHIYGTTLIAGALTSHYLILLQQGDGRCVAISDEGSAFQPIPWDEKCFANVTTSLCDEDAIQRARYCVIDMDEKPIAAVLAGSDGVEDSFATMDLLYVYYRELLTQAVENGIEATNQSLIESLPELSKKGSGDDITICGFADIEKLRQLISVFSRDNEIVQTESSIREIEARLKSMDGMGKGEALKAKYDEAVRCANELEERYSLANAELDGFLEAMEQLNSEEEANPERGSLIARLLEPFTTEGKEIALNNKKEELEEKRNHLEEELKSAKAKLSKIESEYFEFCSRKEQFEKEKADAEDKLANIRGI